MTINFICIGNAHRSIEAEAYFNSLGIKGVEIMSSGSSADYYRNSNEENGAYIKTLALLKRHGIDSFAKTHYGDQIEPGKEVPGDIAVCMNNLVVEDCNRIGSRLPKKTIVWNVTDIGEEGRTPRTEDEKMLFMEDAYQEIVTGVDKLVEDLGLKD